MSRLIRKGLDAEGWYPLEHGFWDHVDSQPWGYRKRGDRWPAERAGGDIELPQCLALNGEGSRCGKWGVNDSPFCAFHYSSAQQWFLGRATREEIDLLTAHAQIQARDQIDVIDAARAIVSHANKAGEQVYFYELVGQDFVKVGKSHQPEQRVKSFMAGQGCKFPNGVDYSTGSLLGTIGGGHVVEKALHQRYRSRRVTGEWFRIDDHLRDDMDALLDAGEFDVTRPGLPLPADFEERFEERFSGASERAS